MATCLPQGTNSDNFYGSLKFEMLVDCSLQGVIHKRKLRLKL